MARRIPRFLVTNLTQSPTTVISASSQNLSAPASRLKDQSLSAFWRSLDGWTIVTGFNDKLDFTRGGAKVATIAPGNYSTGAALATAITAAFEAADPGQGFLCTYSPTTFKFTIAATPTYTIQFGNGPNKDSSAAEDIGFPAVDEGSAQTSRTGDVASYQSRHYVLFDLGSALTIRAFVVRQFNALASGVFKFHSDSTSPPWVTPTGTVTLTGNQLIRLFFFNPSAHRYRVLVINDVQNPVGYAEVGEIFIGDYVELPGYSPVFIKRISSLSTIEYAISGAHYFSKRQNRNDWSIRFGPVLSETDRLAIEAIVAAAPMGTSFFLALDATVDPTNTHYVHIDEPVEESYAPTGSLTVTMHVTESLG